MAGDVEQLSFDFGPPRDLPMVDVPRGLYGHVIGWGPNGAPATRTGYVIKPPRLYTGGFAGGSRRKRYGEPLLYCVILELPRDGLGGAQCGTYCRPDATFRELVAPAEHPLKIARSLSRRMPVMDLRSQDTFYHWDENGRPRYQVVTDPTRLNEGHCRVAVLRDDGSPLLRELPEDLWVDVVDPEREPWIGSR